MLSFVLNGVRDFGDGMVNVEVEMGLKIQVGFQDIVFVLLVVVLVCFVYVLYMGNMLCYYFCFDRSCLFL